MYKFRSWAIASRVYGWVFFVTDFTWQMLILIKWLPDSDNDDEAAPVAVHVLGIIIMFLISIVQTYFGTSTIRYIDDFYVDDGAGNLILDDSVNEM